MALVKDLLFTPKISFALELEITRSIFVCFKPFTYQIDKANLVAFTLLWSSKAF
jgi:hypothetical protein